MRCGARFGAGGEDFGAGASTTVVFSSESVGSTETPGLPGASAIVAKLEQRFAKGLVRGALSPTRTTVCGGEWTTGKNNFKLLFSKVHLNEQCV